VSIETGIHDCATPSQFGELEHGIVIAYSGKYFSAKVSRTDGANGMNSILSGMMIPIIPPFLILRANIATIPIHAKRIFYSSSACMYPEHNQLDPDNPNCEESSAYPANPDSEYGWEKLFSERLYLAFQRNYGLDVRIARFHNIFGPKSC
jgi:hypothetical protein